MTSAVLWLFKYFENPKGPWGPGCQYPPEIRPFKTHNSSEVLFFSFFLNGAYGTEYHRKRGRINLVILREGTINVSAVNCFGDATALGGCYHRNKSPHRCTVHAHANPAISGGAAETSYFLWTLIWLCWTHKWSDWRLVLEWSLSQILWFVGWLSETCVWLSSIKDSCFSIIVQGYALWSAKQQVFLQ